MFLRGWGQGNFLGHDFFSVVPDFLLGNSLYKTIKTRKQVLDFFPMALLTRFYFPAVFAVQQYLFFFGRPS